MLHTLGRIPICQRLYLLLKRLATWLGGGISSNGAQVCSRRSLKMNWSFSPRSSLWVMPKVEWWSHFSPRDSNLWKVSLMMISWNCNITLMNEMSNMAAPKAHLSSSSFLGNHSREINKVGSSILRLFWKCKVLINSFLETKIHNI